MIELTRINGTKVLVNPDLMELVEETPDTVVAFTTGRKIIVKESRQEIKNLVKSYRKIFLRFDAKKGENCGFGVNFGPSALLRNVCVWYH